jgi:hypothetical protein
MERLTAKSAKDAKKERLVLTLGVLRELGGKNLGSHLRGISGLF